MKMFDPLRFLCPIITSGKIITSSNKRYFNLERARWGEWYGTAESIRSFPISRSYSDIIDPITRKLHTFTDASNQAYACVSYWRFIHADNSIRVAFIMSKSRVVPLKYVSVPRFELQAAVLGVRLAKTIRDQHNWKPTSRLFWCDSRTVPAWIRSTASDSKTFVRNGIGKIMELSQADKWHWIPNYLGVADDALNG